jgi:alkanesulfonate monooxygenase SsuD/methylene tetrahydromethanopterin reductase-like flavin-dependent oxidoreductase (luciferase family)
MCRYRAAMTPRFGIQLAPDVRAPDGIRALARRADEEGLDLLGMQDHPYAASQLDTFSLLAMVLADTENLRVFPDVACLPVRGPAMLAKAATSLDQLSGGRFEMGLGAGSAWTAIAAMGGPHRSPGQALKALEDSIAIMRAMWGPEARVTVDGTHYSITGLEAGPPPAHSIDIWLGSVGPKALSLTGRLADGWAAPIPQYLPYERWTEAQGIIDDAARRAGRDPGAIARLAQIVGTVTAEPAKDVPLQGDAPIRTDPAGWADVIRRAATMGFDSFIYWPETPDETQLLRWTREVLPAARELLENR